MYVCIGHCFKNYNFPKKLLCRCTVGRLNVALQEVGHSYFLPQYQWHHHVMLAQVKQEQKQNPQTFEINSNLPLVE
jgi:hypothetical protein